VFFSASPSTLSPSTITNKPDYTVSRRLCQYL